MEEEAKSDEIPTEPVTETPTETVPTEPPAPPTPEIIEVRPRENTVTITEIVAPQGDALGKEKNQKTLWKSFLEKVTFNKKKKLDRIMNFVTERGKISNDDVEKLLKVSDRTATRYLNTLEKEGRLKQIGASGKHTHYTTP